MNSSQTGKDAVRFVKVFAKRSTSLTLTKKRAHAFVDMGKSDMGDNKIKLFEEKQVRTIWDEEKEKWWFSVVDVIEILTEQPTHDHARKYWSVMKTRLKKEGAQPTTICSQLKMEAYDGKMRLTDVADTEQLLRIVQSVPSKKAEPFKMWLAKVGSERLDETVDPEQSIDRAIQNYRRLGYSERVQSPA